MLEKSKSLYDFKYLHYGINLIDIDKDFVHNEHRKNIFGEFI